MSKAIQIHSAIRIGGSVVLANGLTDFPANPEAGQLELVNHGLYGYINVGGVLTWYPLVKAPDSFQYTQAVAAQEWVIQHNLGTQQVFYQIQEDNGQVMMAADVIIVDDNTVKLEFGEAVTGRVLLLTIGGERGAVGERGVDGDSAYQVAVNNGFTGTVAEWLESLKGADGIIGHDGLSAYELAVAGGYVGTQAQWLATLVGPAGEKGDTGPQGIPGGDSVFKDNGTFAQSGGTLTLDYTQGKHQRFQVGAAMTLAFSNWPTLASGLTGEMLLEIQNGAAFTLTWPTIKWLKSDGTFTTSFASSDTTLQAANTDFVLLWTRDGGATIYGKVMR